MAYCIQCGNPIEENIKFCSSCGHSVYHSQQNKSEKTNSREVIHCTTCGHEVSADAKFCHNCAHSLTPLKTVASTVTPDFHVEKKESPISGYSDKRTNGRRRKIGIIIIIAITLLGACIAAVILLSTPMDEYLKIGNSQYLFSKEAQQYLQIEDTSEYVSNKSILIIEEPHSDLGKQFNLYKGLEIFFRDNPNLINKTTFLAEGYPSQQKISIQQLIDVEPNPDDETIKTVLGSFLITGYTAYVWKAQNHIPIIGNEDDRIYWLSAQQYINLMENPNAVDSINQNNYWEYSVIARNEQMAMTQINMSRKYENPLLFVGALHLAYTQDADTFSQTKSQIVQYAGKNSTYLRNVQNKGITDYLKEYNIGYTILSSRKDISTSYDQKRLDTTYLALFDAQRKENYDEYINNVLFESYGIVDYSPVISSGVTVRPATKEAAHFAAAAKGSRTPAKGKPGSKEEFPNGKGGKTVREYGDDGNAVKDTDYGHDHGKGDPHDHNWDWGNNPPRQP